MKDDFQAMRENSQQKRGSNREQSRQLLEDGGVVFEVKNNGAHLIVEGNDCYIDFWPGTGKWKTRNGESGFGVRNLLKLLDT